MRPDVLVSHVHLCIFTRVYMCSSFIRKVHFPFQIIPTRPLLARMASSKYGQDDSFAAHTHTDDPPSSPSAVMSQETVPDSAYGDRPGHPALTDRSMDGLFPAQHAAQGGSNPSDPALTQISLGDGFSPYNSPVMQHFRYVYYGEISDDTCPAQVSQGSTQNPASAQTGSGSSPISTAENGADITSENLPRDDGHVFSASVQTGDGDHHDTQLDQNQENGPPSSSTGTTELLRQAKVRLVKICDQCYRRRIKCSGELMNVGECAQCQRFRDTCTWDRRNEHNGRYRGTFVEGGPHIFVWDGSRPSK